MQKLIFIFLILCSSFLYLSTQTPESDVIIQSFELFSIQTGKTKVTIEFNNKLLRKNILYEKPDEFGDYQQSSKYIYEYNAQDLMSMRKTLVLQDGQWNMIEHFVYEYEFDEHGNRTKYVQLKNDINIEELDTSQIIETSYNEYGNIIENIEKSRVSAKTMQNKNRNLYEYTATQKVKTNTKYVWQNDNWIEYGLIRKYYNDDDMLICDSTFMWNGSSWNFSMLYNYDYDNSQNIVLYEIYLFIEDIWQKMEKYTYTYDDQNRNIETIKYLPFNDNWEMIGKSTVDFREDGQIENEKGYGNYDGTWINNFRKEYKYNNDAQIIEVITLLLSDEEWTNSNRFIYEYSNKKHLQSIKYEKWINDNWEKSDISLNFNDNYYSYKYSGYEIKMHWVFTSIDEILNRTKFELYPNPAFDVINIKTQNIILFIELSDYLGKTIFLHSDNVEQISTTGLAPGIYLLKLYTAGGEVLTEKVVVR